MFDLKMWLEVLHYFSRWRSAESCSVVGGVENFDFSLHEKVIHLTEHMPSAARHLAGLKIRLFFLSAKTLRVFLAPFSPTYFGQTLSMGSLCSSQLGFGSEESVSCLARCSDSSLLRVPCCLCKRKIDTCPKPCSWGSLHGGSTAQDTEWGRGRREREGEGGRGIRLTAISQPRVRAFTRDPVADLQQPVLLPGLIFPWQHWALYSDKHCFPLCGAWRGKKTTFSSRHHLRGGEVIPPSLGE